MDVGNHEAWFPLSSSVWGSLNYPWEMIRNKSQEFLRNLDHKWNQWQGQ